MVADDAGAHGAGDGTGRRNCGWQGIDDQGISEMKMRMTLEPLMMRMTAMIMMMMMMTRMMRMMIVMR